MEMILQVVHIGLPTFTMSETNSIFQLFSYVFYCILHSLFFTPLSDILVGNNTPYLVYR